jgi:hypothetical protein
MTHANKWSVLLVLAAGFTVGCEPPPVKPVPAPMPAPVPQTRAEMTRALVQEDDQFDQAVQQLPGSSAEEHRQALVMLLDRLPKILKLINGEVESPEFKNRIKVIMAAKATVSQEGVDRRRMEAVENQALQSASPTFAAFAALYLYDDKDLPPLMDSLSSAITIASKSVGPMHDLDATYAFVKLQAVVDRFTADLVDRFLTEAGPTPAMPDQTVTPPAVTPATEPAATPATPAVTPQPATEPATAPATPTTDATTSPATPTTDATTQPAAPATAPTTSP